MTARPVIPDEETRVIRPQYWTRDMEKQVTSRIHAVINNPRLLSVYQAFGGHAFRRSSVFHGLEQLLADNAVSGECCFEIGTWNGITAIVLAQFFNKVVTVDIAHNPLKHKVIAHLGLTNITCIDLESNDDKRAAIADLDFDCAYLDGNHAADTENDYDLVKHCGRVIFQEVWPFQSPVWELVHWLPQHQIIHGGCGLAIWDASK